jgi:hypothetical protein
MNIALGRTNILVAEKPPQDLKVDTGINGLGPQGVFGALVASNINPGTLCSLGPSFPHHFAVKGLPKTDDAV